MQDALLSPSTSDRVRRNSAGNLLEDPESAKDTPPRGVAQISSFGTMEIEDAYAEIGGLGRYQLWHMGVLVSFWFFNVGTAMSVFANTPWCAAEGRPALCVGPDEEVPKSPDVFWSDCRSLSCQFDLQPNYCGGTADDAGNPCSLNAAGDGCTVESGDCEFVPDNGRAYMRPLFDSSFFLGWLWSVTVFGFVSDRFGRRSALYGALTVFIIAHVGGAFAPNATSYLVLRHFMGVGIGSSSITAYVLGSELSPRKTAPAVKVFFSTVGAIGTSGAALVLRPMLWIPGYNWRVMALLSVIPTVLFTLISVCTIDESPRWVLITRGETEAKVLLRRIALRNDPSGKYLPVLDSIKLRIPKKTKSYEKAYQLFFKAGLRWRMVGICLLWFSSGFSLYGLTLGVNSLSGDRYYNSAIMAAAEVPTRLLNIPLMDSRAGRKFGLLMWLLILASASLTAMFWTENPGPLTLNVVGRAASAAGFVAVYVWSTELLPTSVRSGGMGLGSTAARFGSVAAPWAAQLGDLLPIPESLANDLPLALFGSFAVIAGTVALVVLPETKGTRCPETIVDAVLELRTAKKSALPTQIAAVLISAIGIGLSVIVGTIVAEAAQSRAGGVAAGVGLSVVVLGAVGGCYKACGPKKTWRQLHREKGRCCC